jgi:hypothetical protein
MARYVMVRGRFLSSPPREKSPLRLTRDISRAYDFGASANAVARGYASGEVLTTNPMRRRR